MSAIGKVEPLPSLSLWDAIDERTAGILERRRLRSAHHRRGWLVRRMLLLADVLGLVISFVVAAIVFGGGPGERLGEGGEFALFFLTLPAWVVLAKLHGLYERDEERADHSTVDDLVGVVHLVTFGAWGFFVTSWVTGLADPQVGKLVSFWLGAVLLITLGRSLARASCRHRETYLQNTIIVGAGDVGQLIARKLLKHPEYGLHLVGFVDDRPKEQREDIDELTLLGASDRLAEIVQTLDIERVVVAFSNESDERTMEIVRTLRELDVQIDIVPRLFELVGPKVGLHTIEGLPLVGLPPVRLTPSSRLMKRTIDIVGASIMLALASPIFAFIAWKVWRGSPGPIFFRQTRLGLNMREFTALKFRTMKADTDADEHRAYIKRIMSSSAATGSNGLYKLDRGDAVTSVGRWLRKTSLDELPQLINVIRGDMSLVGPRPCIGYEVEQFKPHHYERFLVPAGLTGLWQVTARAHSTFAEALEMDVVYARGWSVGLDLRLLFRTPFQVLRQKAGTA